MELQWRFHFVASGVFFWLAVPNSFQLTFQYMRIYPQIKCKFPYTIVVIPAHLLSILLSHFKIHGASNVHQERLGWIRISWVLLRHGKGNGLDNALNLLMLKVNGNGTTEGRDSICRFLVDVFPVTGDI